LAVVEKMVAIAAAISTLAAATASLCFLIASLCLLTERLLVGFEDGVLDLLKHHITEVLFVLHLLLRLANLLPCLLIFFEQAHVLHCLTHPLHVAEEVLRVAVVVPHGLAALHTIRELDFDGWDLSGGIQLVEPLRDVGDRRPEAPIATFYVVALEAFRDLLGERHLFVFSLQGI
jgi:hypothetical protein